MGITHGFSGIESVNNGSVPSLENLENHLKGLGVWEQIKQFFHKFQTLNGTTVVE